MALLCDGPTVHAYHLDTGAELGVAELPVPVSEAAISPDGRTAVIGDEDGNVHFFALS